MSLPQGLTRRVATRHLLLTQHRTRASLLQGGSRQMCWSVRCVSRVPLTFCPMQSRDLVPRYGALIHATDGLIRPPLEDRGCPRGGARLELDWIGCPDRPSQVHETAGPNGKN